MAWVLLWSMPCLPIWISRSAGTVRSSHDQYERGIPAVELENGLLPVIGKTRKTGTWVQFSSGSGDFRENPFLS